MYQIFVIQIVFQSSDRVEPDFCDVVIKITLNFKSRDTKKSNFPPKGPTTFKFWEMKLLLLLLRIYKTFQVCFVGYKVMAKR